MSFTHNRDLKSGPGGAFLLSVLGAAAATGSVTAALLLIENGNHFEFPDAFLIGGVAFLVAGVVVGIAAALIGLPMTLLLSRYRLEHPLTYPLAGFVAGGFVFTLVPALTGDTRSGSVLEFLPWSWIGALPGCICGGIWWLTYRRHVQQSGE